MEILMIFSRHQVLHDLRTFRVYCQVDPIYIVMHISGLNDVSYFILKIVCLFNL